MKERVHIGDGAYYAFDGWGIELTTSNGITTTNRVYLEPEVVAEFLRRLAGDYPVDKLANAMGITVHVSTT